MEEEGVAVFIFFDWVGGVDEDTPLSPPPSHCGPPPSPSSQVDYMDENDEYFQRQASHRQSRRRFRKINQKGERQTIIDTVDPYPAGKPPVGRGYHTVSFRSAPPPSARQIGRAHV